MAEALIVFALLALAVIAEMQITMLRKDMRALRERLDRLDAHVAGGRKGSAS